ncbi:MAG TPA: transporter substrate-binding domain-containing protein [Longimicrobiaceae bacterium]|nr:transporter substrate-binding domain-containing protein [Longimicrobiaceae bacterium]
MAMGNCTLIRAVQVVLTAVMCCVAAGPASSVTAQEPVRNLVVGVKAAAPFAIQDADGRWSGISVELWRSIARDLGYRFELRDTTLEGVLQGVADGTYDVGLGALTITAERESALDFTQPFYVTGLGIAVPASADVGWLGVIRQFLSLSFLRVVLGLTVLLLVVGALVWFFERRHNEEQFDQRPLRGVGSGIWWSAVTMTTVGYGDKAPQSYAGRIIGLIWMFTGVIIISSFTAAITSSLTVGKLQGPVQGPSDLPNPRVGAVRSSTSADYLSGNRVGFTSYDTAVDGLRALERGELQALVYDMPILRYEIASRQINGVRVLPNAFEEQYYGIALGPSSALREEIDRALLARITSPGWEALLSRYLGR